MWQDPPPHRRSAIESELTFVLSQFAHSRFNGADQHELARLELITLLEDAFNDDDRGAINAVREAIDHAEDVNARDELLRAFEAAAQTTWFEGENNVRLEARLFVVPIQVMGRSGVNEVVHADDALLNEMMQSFVRDGLFAKDAIVVLASNLYQSRDLEQDDMLAVNRYLRGLCQSHWKELGRPSTWQMAEPVDVDATMLQPGFFVGAVIGRADIDPFDYLLNDQRAISAQKWQKSFGRMLNRLLLRLGYETLVKPALPVPYFEGLRQGAAMLQGR